MIVEPEMVEADLAAGRLCCPACEGPLRRWGFARERQVRIREGIRSIRPRRACCQPCGTTHVLLPAWAVPRRRDGAEVIGQALLDNARGLGHRRIAARLGWPPGTVRGWLRTFASRAELISASARRWTHAIDRGKARRNLAALPLNPRGSRRRPSRRVRRPALPSDYACRLNGG